MDEHEKKQPEDLEEAKATVLSAREAMSIIAPNAAPYPDPAADETPDETGPS